MKNWKSRESSKRVPDARDLSRRRRNFLRRAVKSSTEDFLITVATSEILPPSFFEYRIAMTGRNMRAGIFISSYAICEFFDVEMFQDAFCFGASIRSTVHKMKFIHVFD